ncbi:Uncharacterised protein [Mycobacterium tuberculosis]|nr:Uncharacterised protein [Mycobacterium tuberculosis]
MMFNSLDILINVALIYSDDPHELFEQAVAIHQSLPDLLPFWRQHQATIFFINKIFVFVELLNHLRDRRGMYFQRFSNIRDSSIALFFN